MLTLTVFDPRSPLPPDRRSG